MSFSEFLRLIGTDWGLALLSLILLYMFIKRLKRVKDFLSIAGTVSTVILLLLLAFLQWNRYTTATAIYNIISTDPSAYTIMTPQKDVLVQPVIITMDNVRYVIDATEQQEKGTPARRYYAWDIVALPQN